MPTGISYDMETDRIVEPGQGSYESVSEAGANFSAKVFVEHL